MDSGTLEKVIVIPSSAMEKIMRMARDLCLADGHDPDQQCFDVPLSRGPRASFLMPEERYIVPAWAFYTDQAEAFLRAQMTEAAS